MLLSGVQRSLVAGMSGYLLSEIFQYAASEHSGVYIWSKRISAFSIAASTVPNTSDIGKRRVSQYYLFIYLVHIRYRIWERGYFSPPASLLSEYPLYESADEHYANIIDLDPVQVLRVLGLKNTSNFDLFQTLIIQNLHF